MRRILIAALVLTAAVLCWQRWQLTGIRHTLLLREAALKNQTQALAKKNAQLLGLSILTETHSRQQSQLYAAAEENASLLRRRRQHIEELKRENEALRRWADDLLPADIVRLHDRPSLTGGAAYRTWLSGRVAVPSGTGVTAP